MADTIATMTTLIRDNLDETAAGYWTDANVRRFDSKTRQSPSGCLEWAGAKDKRGYGHFSVGGRCRLAHRVSWQRKFGAVPRGLSILHGCDNPSCVLIGHLSLGTQQENMADASARKRWIHSKRGEAHHGTRLTDKIVLEMRRLYGTAFYYRKDISERFGVSKATTANILSRKTWSHI